MNSLYYGDNLTVLRGCISGESVDLDAANRGFRLRPESPALAPGCEPFDVTTAGARGQVGP